MNEYKEPKINKIQFWDGTSIVNLEMNGTCLIAPTPIPEKYFDGAIRCDAKLFWDDGRVEDVPKFRIIKPWSEKSEVGRWFAVIPLSKTEIEKNEVNGKIDYLSMMTGVDL